MSLLGFSSYILVTQKGQTRIPFCRGSCFLVNYQSSSFYSKHVLTAAHVVRPQKFKTYYGNPVAFERIGERHLSYKMMLPSSECDESGKPNFYPLALVPKLYPLPQCHVISLRVKDEAKQITEVLQGAPKQLEAMSLDPGRISNGEEVILAGIECEQDSSAVDDGTLILKERRIEGVCRAALVSEDFGTVLIVTTAEKVPSSFSGGAVLRKSTGKCVGVIAISTVTSPEQVGEVTPIVKTIEPVLNLTEDKGVIKAIGGEGTWGAAIVPIPEFLDPLRRQEVV